MRSALASPKVFPQMKGFICCSWGVFNGVEGKEGQGAIKDPDVKELFDQLAGSEHGSFVDPNHVGVMNGSNASLVVLDARGKVVDVFNDFHTLERDFREAWEQLKLTPAQFPSKTTYTFPGVKGTAPSKGPGASPAGADFTYLVKDPGPAFRLFAIPGEKSSKVVVEARAMSPEQREALSWSSQPREVAAKVFKSLFDTINPGGVARAADVVVPWAEIPGALRYQPAGSEGKFRFAVLSGPIRMSKKGGTFRAEGTFQVAVSYLQDAPEPQALRGAINVKYVGGGVATADRPVHFSIALVTTPEPKEIPPAFQIPLARE